MVRNNANRESREHEKASYFNSKRQNLKTGRNRSFNNRKTRQYFDLKFLSRKLKETSIKLLT